MALFRNIPQREFKRFMLLLLINNLLVALAQAYAAEALHVEAHPQPQRFLLGAGLTAVLLMPGLFALYFYERRRLRSYTSEPPA